MGGTANQVTMNSRSKYSIKMFSKYIIIPNVMVIGKVGPMNWEICCKEMGKQIHRQHFGSSNRQLPKEKTITKRKEREKLLLNKGTKKRLQKVE